MSVRSSLWLLMEGECYLCSHNLNVDSHYDMMFPEDNFVIHRVCKDCYKKEYMKTNRSRIYKKMLMEVI